MGKRNLDSPRVERNLNNLAADGKRIGDSVVGRPPIKTGAREKAEREAMQLDQEMMAGYQQAIHDVPAPSSAPLHRPSTRDQRRTSQERGQNQRPTISQRFMGFIDSLREKL